MKRTSLVVFVFTISLFIGACDEDIDWDPNDYEVVTLDAGSPFYHFINEKVYAGTEMPYDIDDYGIINEPWCTDLPGLCGNILITDETDFASFNEFPDGEFDNTCKNIPLNKVIVFKLEDDTYALVKIVDDVYTEGENGCEHKITIHVNYPALESMEEEEVTDDSEISRGEWTFITETTGTVVQGLSSFEKYGSSVYVAGNVPITSFVGHFGELQFEMSSYKRNSTPGYFNTSDIVCRNKTQINVCGDAGQFARFNNNNSEYDVQITDGYFMAQTLSFPTDDHGYVASGKELFRTNDGGRTWKKCFSFERGGKLFFTSQTVGFLLKKIGSDEGRIYKTTNSGTDFTPYSFPMHWYDQPNVNYVSGLYFLDENRGWICADYGQIIATTNGGKDWQIIRNGGENEPHLYDIEFSSEEEGWACGADGMLLRTSDGGETWNKVDVGETDNFVAIEFNSPYCGWLATSGKLYFYEDWDGYARYFRNL